MQSRNESVDDRAGDELEARDASKNGRTQEPLLHIQALGAGLASRRRLSRSSALSRSLSAWKFIRTRWRRTGRVRAATSSYVTWYLWRASARALAASTRY